MSKKPTKENDPRERFASDLQAGDQSVSVSAHAVRPGPCSGTLSRRRFLGGMGAAAVAAAVGCKDRSPSGVEVDGGPDEYDDGGVDLDGGQDDGPVVVEDGGQNGGEEGPDLSILRAFPGAEGSGAESVGGRGGRIIEVTNLNDSGPGSLRAAIEEEGPRVVIFRVSGTIVLSTRLWIRSPYITIAGQTAPGGGIQIAGKEPGTLPMGSGQTADRPKDLLRIGTHNVIVRYLRLRKGSLNQKTYGAALSIGIHSTSSVQTDVEDVIVDHVSCLWGDLHHGIYDQYGGHRLQRISLQNSILGETLYSSGQLMIGSSSSFETAGDEMYDIDLHRNLLTTGFGRIPLFGQPGRLINNIFYNTRNALTRVGSRGGDYDIIKNILIAHGPAFSSSSRGHYEIGVAAGSSKEEDWPYVTIGISKVYLHGNWGDIHGYDNYNMLCILATSGGGDSNANAAPDNYRNTEPKPNPAIPVAQVDVDDLEDHILPTIGASQRLEPINGGWVFNRDAADIRVVEEGYKNRSQDFLVEHEDQVGGFPTIASGTADKDSAGDGISDSWKERNGFSPNQNIGSQLVPSSANVANGWTYLDLFLAGIDLPT